MCGARRPVWYWLGTTMPMQLSGTKGESGSQRRKAKGYGVGVGVRVRVVSREFLLVIPSIFP